MNGKDAMIITELAAIVGRQAVTTDAFELAPWSRDWRGRYHGKALCMVSPATTAEVAQLVTLAAQNHLPLVPQGGNTSTVGGATPSTDGRQIILSLRRMNTVRSLDPVNKIAVVEAGVVLETLHIAAAAQGCRFPLSLAAKGSATVGGLVSTNAGGTQVLRFGTMRALVLGLEFVLPNGQVHSGLSSLPKDNRGYELTQLMIGAEGTLGIITAASLRLVPAIVDTATAWVGVQSPASALAVLRFLENEAGNAIESFEIIAQTSLAAALLHIPGTRAPLVGHHEWHILIDYVGQGATAALERLLGDVLQLGLVEDVVIAANSAQAAAFWQIRESLSAAEKATGPAVQHDLSVPVAAMPDFINAASKAVEAAFNGTTATAFGHLGDGNVHFHVRAPVGANPKTWRDDQGEAVARFVHDLVIAAGGSISAEHGIGQSLRGELLRLSSPARISALRAIKLAMDPLGIMNPGKLVPLASDASAA